MIRFVLAALLLGAPTGTWSGGVYSVPGPSFCGRKCVCGTGNRVKVYYAGSMVDAVEPPSSDHCTCAEVYQCVPQAEGAPANPAPLRPSCYLGNGSIFTQ
jgi:hypothetical protein